MKTKFIVNLPGCLLALCTAVVFAWITVLTVQRGFYFAAVMFLAMTVLYTLVALKNGAVVHLSETGVAVHVLGRCLYRMDWRAIKEVGVLGTRVFALPKAKRRGTLYVYYAAREMTAEERFELCLKWPPRKMIYHSFSDETGAALGKFWQRKVALYNTPENFVLEG